MSIDLRAAAGDHLRARRTRGYRLADHDWLISSFLDSLPAEGETTITIEGALAFANAPSGAQSSWRAARLSVIRSFAAYVHGLDPAAAEVIPAGLIASRTARRIPYLYSDRQIAELVSRSGALSPPQWGATMTTLVALLAATGLRSGEAGGLDVEDLDLEAGLLNVTGKFARQRLVPVHPTTVEALIAYQAVRATMTSTPSTGPLFLGATGKRLEINRARRTFRSVANACDLPTRPGCRPPRLHDFRHTFAVNSLIDAHRQGADVDARIAALATYLGHVNPLNTYWYLTASPELMALVTDRMSAHQDGRRP